MKSSTIVLSVVYLSALAVSAIVLPQVAAAEPQQETTTTQATGAPTVGAFSVQNADVSRVGAVDRIGNDGPPEGVPPEIHRKVVQLYKRIHNAFPDASRQRVFNKIAEELGIHPQRLWNAYHSAGPNRPGVDLHPVDRVTDLRAADSARDHVADRARDRTTDRVADRPSDRVAHRRIDRAPDRPLIRDRVRIDRPTGIRPGRK